MITLEDRQVQFSEWCEKVSHVHHHPQPVHEAGLHLDQQMIETIRGCQVLIAVGMGQPMYYRATAIGLEVFPTGEDGF